MRSPISPKSIKNRRRCSSPGIKPLRNNSNQENIKVIVRVRPALQTEKRVCVVVRNDDRISIRNGGLETAYHFDHVARSSTRQAEMMSLVGQPATDKCLAGYNATVFCYGQTGSGTTLS